DHAVEHAEDGGRSPDAEGQRERGRRRERGSTAERAEGVAQIGAKGLHARSKSEVRAIRRDSVGRCGFPSLARSFGALFAFPKPLARPLLGHPRPTTGRQRGVGCAPRGRRHGMARAIRIEKTGGPEVMKLAEVQLQKPDKGQALVRVEAAGVNFIDIYQRSGLYKLDLPFTLGQEGAGVVESVGAGVT